VRTLKLSKKDMVRYIVFCIGLAIAIGSLGSSVVILWFNINGIPVLVVESNLLVVILEIIGIVFSGITIFVASEIYYKYLKLNRMIYKEDMRE